MSETTSANTLPPNSYNKIEVIHMYFGKLPTPTIFDKLTKPHNIKALEKLYGTRENLEYKLKDELQKIGKIKLLNDKYEVVDEGIISGFDDKTTKIDDFGIIIKHFLGNKTHKIDYSIISFEKSLDEIGSTYIDLGLKEFLIKPKLEPTKKEVDTNETVGAEDVNLEIGGRKTKRRKSKRRKSRRRKYRMI